MRHLRSALLRFFFCKPQLGFAAPGSSSQAAGATAAAVVWFLVLSFLGPVGSGLSRVWRRRKGFVALGVVRWPGPSLYGFFKVCGSKAGKINQLVAPHEGSKALCVGKRGCLGNVERYFLQLAGLFRSYECNGCEFIFVSFFSCLKWCVIACL